MSYSKTTLRDVWVQSKKRCGRCKRKWPLESHGTKWHVGHIKAKSLGGKNQVTNLWVECIPCNLSAGADHQGNPICAAIKDSDAEPCSHRATGRSIYCGKHQGWRR